MISSAVAAIAILGTQAQTVDPSRTAMPKGMKESSTLRADFNLAKGIVKLMFIFSPS